MSTDFKAVLILTAVLAVVGYCLFRDTPTATLSQEEEAKALSQIHPRKK